MHFRIIELQSKALVLTQEQIASRLINKRVTSSKNTEALSSLPLSLSLSLSLCHCLSDFYRKFGVLGRVASGSWGGSLLNLKRLGLGTAARPGTPRTTFASFLNISVASYEGMRGPMYVDEFVRPQHLRRCERRAPTIPAVNRGHRRMALPSPRIGSYGQLLWILHVSSGSCSIWPMLQSEVRLPKAPAGFRLPRDANC